MFSRQEISRSGTPAPSLPRSENGWLYGRGSVDDKGNLYLLLKAATLHAASGSLPVNVRIVCDGEEETGGHSVVDFLAEDERGGDACVIFDSMMPRLDAPSFEVGTRGLVYFRLDVRTGEQDLHSGLFGGAAMNALHALMQALAAVVSLPDELRAGTIPPTEDELGAWQVLSRGGDVLAHEGARPSDGAAARDFYLRTFAAPAVDVNGIRGGEPDLVKTVLPVSAHAHVSIRLAPGQDVEEISTIFETLVRNALPAGADLDVHRLNASPASRVDPQAPALDLARQAFERVLGARPLLTRTGGSLPIMSALEAKGISTVLTGFGAPGHNAHAPNERLLARYLPEGVAAAKEMLVAFGELPTRAGG